MSPTSPCSFTGLAKWMARLWLSLVGLVCATSCLAADSQESNLWKITRQSGPRFASVDVLIDPASAPLAAYQVRIAASRGDVSITGIEGGEHHAFREPPYYDPKAMQKDTVVLGAFNTAPSETLPNTRIRVATIHLLIRGRVTPRFQSKLVAAADPAGNPIHAVITLNERSQP